MKPTDRPAEMPLSDFLCFAVYSTNLAFGKAYKPMLEALGLTYSQYIAIVALREEDAQTVSGLGEKLFLESNTLTPMLKKLEAMGYVERRRDPEDERQVRVSLTKSGRRLREKCLKMDLTDATALAANEFAKLQKQIVSLRENLIKHVQGR
ncbi:MarR family winged helix-turn-helix transcriptional regulator [Paraburkholderia lycopersici]|uniref:HTH-type transcriptional regulator SarZ n=1 Tax=Paraburkholderia lycopersici TaxID=416944 RepID=A0A1G6TL73_9BURK|nr:MarR family transcriptional regulator [Paraburkholderia lycopersici]SDD29838.1 DNA-binding transcriptional regulator, MarR family [Paraburkholderia lycopersici]